MSTPSSCLDRLLQSLPARPIPKETLDALALRSIEDSQTSSTAEIRKLQWELLLRSKVYELAEREGGALAASEEYSRYYDDLRERLDIVLTFTEHGACESTVPFSIAQDLLETQTIASCSHIFAWIEQRRDRLTVDMVPQKGKALVLLRTLNDLLRRLSKTGNNTKFCGRILTFLSAVFPLGERSGVNLRGEYGPQWEAVTHNKPPKDSQMDVDESMESVQTQDATPKTDLEQGADSAKVGKPGPPKLSPETTEVVKEEFYDTFWWLQLPFSRPTQFVLPGTMETFKVAVDTVMAIVKEATIKERAMMGSKAVVGSLKRKHGTTPTSTDNANQNYLFAKFLTSPELLNLEIADTHFRRQFLFQLLILLSHLLQFTLAEKAKWASPRNRSLQMDFTLEPADAKWAQDMTVKAYEELRQTAPSGRAFADTVQTILERETNWIKWKNDLCNPFDKEPLRENLEESTAQARKRRRTADPEYQHKLGSKALSEIWALGYTNLRDLQTPFRCGDVKSFVRDIDRENARINMRKAQLEKQAQMQRARIAQANKPSTPILAPQQIVTPTPSSINNESNAVVTSSSPAQVIVAPAPQRPQPAPSAPAPTSSPLLHPSLPAKPLTTPVKSSPRPSTPAPASIATIPQSSTPAPPPVTEAASSASAATSAAKTTSGPPPPEVNDPIILRHEEIKLRISWLALRTARERYLHLFGKIGTGDVLQLMQEIEKEVKEREAAVAALAAKDASTPATDAQDAVADKDVTAPSNSEIDMSQNAVSSAADSQTMNDEVSMTDVASAAV